MQITLHRRHLFPTTLCQRTRAIWISLAPTRTRSWILSDLSRAFSFTALTPFSSLSSSASEKIIASEDPPPEPPDSSVQPRDNLDYGPADSGCNLPVTNPRTVQHFGLTPQLWPNPRWIKFANNQRERSTHYADFGQIIGKVAILESAPDTLISVPVLCRKGFEVSFKIPGGVGIYLQGKLVHQDIIEEGHRSALSYEWSDSVRKNILNRKCFLNFKSVRKNILN